MPNRLLRDGILNSKRVNALSEDAELFYRRLMSVVDDYGRCEADLDMLLASCYPLRRERTTKDVSNFLEECSSGDHPLIVVYQAGRKTYLEIQDFNQRLRSTTSKYPGPEGPGAVSQPMRADGGECPHLADIGQSSAARAHGRARSSPSPTSTSTPTPMEGGLEETKPDLRRQLWDAYPEEGRTDWGAFCAAWDACVDIHAFLPLEALFTELMAGLLRWKASDKWGRGVIHSIANWVFKGIWKEHPPKARGQPAAAQRNVGMMRDLVG